MQRVRASIVFVLFVTVLCFSACAQTPATGLYPFGSFDNLGFDSINIGNLNIHFQIPIVNKPGRGMPFRYSLSYDGLIWAPVGSSGAKNWQPSSDWGFHGMTGYGISGYVHYDLTNPNTCRPTDGSHIAIPINTQANYNYIEPSGAWHIFNYSYTYNPCTGESTTTGDGSVSDGSGYRFDGTTVYAKDGTALTAPVVGGEISGASTVTDSNGNYISNDGLGTLTDTLGNHALSISYIYPGDSYTPRVFTYPVALQSDGSTTASVTVSYATHTVQTNFQCSTVTEYGPQAIDLVDRITLADGTFYQFTYENTPEVAGAVTGRLASITLPTGGTIQYQYSGGCNGTGIDEDGSVGEMSRITSDGTRSYGRAPSQNGSTTDVGDENGNHTLYTFTISGNMFYETHHQVHTGNTSGPILSDVSTCYNGSSSPCDGSLISQPITQTNAVSSFNGGSPKSEHKLFDGLTGLLTSDQISDFGGNLLTTTTYNYVSPGRVSQVLTVNQVGNMIAKQTFGYDEQAPTPTSGLPQHTAVAGPRGNATSSNVWVDPWTVLSTTTIFDDAGVPLSSTGPNGTTTYSYDSTQGFATQITPPTPSSGISVPSYASYDTASGAQLSASDANFPSSPQVQYSQYDKLLRPIHINRADGGSTSYTYGRGPWGNQVNAITTLNSSGNAETDAIYDDYGRFSRTATHNGRSPGANDWYQTDYCYDAVGNLHFVTTKYENNGFEAPKQCSGSGTTYSYDALGRVTSISTVDGNTTYEYNSRAVRTTDPYGVQKIVQYDALGRITAVCEVSGSSQQADSPQNCGLDIPGTGYLTTYSYDPATRTTTITQGAQQRILRTDFLGRTTYTKEPESGETTYSYSYNAMGLLVTRQKSKANQFDSTVKTTTLTQYDSLGRVVDVSYDDGITPHKSYTYDKSCCWTNAGSATNLKGRLVTISTGNGNPGNSGALFSYDTMGRVVNMWQCGPSNCSAGQTRRVLSFAYDWGSNLTSEQDEASGKIVYDRSPAGEINSITNQTYNDGGNPSNLVSSVANSAFGPTSYHLGNGLNVQMGYDVVGRYIGMYLCTSNSTDCMTNNTDGLQFGGWSSLGANRIYFRCDTVVGSCNNYNYDEFGRMSNSYSYGTLTSSYVYDRYGNRWQQTSPQGGPQPNFTFDYSNNRLTTSGFQYDAAGNLVSDGNHSYTYDADGNILSVDNGNTGQYVYDALNRRIRTQSANGTFEYIYDYAGRRISTWDPSTANAIEGRIYWGNRLLAYRAWEGPTYFDHQDYLGTERMRTNYAGSTSSTYSSLPFGDGYTPSADDPQGSGQDNLHFALMEHDSESGTDHAQFRQYSPTQGRWMSPDPYMGNYDFSNPQSFNRYAYVSNDPLTNIDPLGLSPITILPINDDPNFSTTVTANPGEVFPFGGVGGPAHNTPFLSNLYSDQVPGGPLPKRGPNKPSVLNCVSGFAQRTSIAGGLNKFGIGNNGGTGGFLTNALAGNAVSGFVNLFTGEGSMADVAFGGTRGGMPGGATGLNNGISGTLQDSIAVGANAAVNSGAEMTTALGGTVSTAAFTGAEYATAVGWAKFGYDAASYAAGLAGCATGIIH